MSASAPKKAPLPDLKNFLEHRVMVRLTGGRRVTGMLSGCDAFMNLAVRDAVEQVYDGTTKAIGTTVVRGNMVVNIERVEGTAAA